MRPAVFALLLSMPLAARAQPVLVQASFVFENDDGPDADHNTPQAAYDVPRRDVRVGERFTMRIRLDNLGDSVASDIIYRLQYDQGDNQWLDVAPGATLAPSLATADRNGAVIAEPHTAPCTGQFDPGRFWHFTAASAPLSLLPLTCTELAFVVQSGGAVAGATYRLRLWNDSQQAPLSSYLVLPELTLTASAEPRYSKQSGLATAVDVLRGAADGDGLGRSLAVTDLDSDGRSDLVVGVAGDDSAGPNVGRVQVWRWRGGLNRWLVLDDPSPTSGDGMGAAVAVGDFNGDGRADVVTGAPGYDPGGSLFNVGQVYVFLQTTAGDGFAAPRTLDDPTPSTADRMGWSVAAGDFDGNGFDDVVAGAPGDDSLGPNVGQLYVFLRNAANTGFDPGVILDSPTFIVGTQGDDFGTALATGDFNGDGHADILAGAPLDESDGPNVGQAYVFVRNVANDGFSVDVLSHPSPTTGDNFGVAVAAGDVDGDGRVDALVGAHLDDTYAPDQGRAFLFARRTDNLGFAAAEELAVPEAGPDSHVGAALALGDVDGDGRTDVLLGAPGESSGGAAVGRVFLLLRRADNTGFASAMPIDDPTPTLSDEFGSAVAAADFYADGWQEPIVGAPGDDALATDAGETLVFDLRPGRDAQLYLDAAGYRALLPDDATFESQRALANQPLFVFAVQNSNVTDPIEARWQGLSTVGSRLHPFHLEVLRRLPAPTWEPVAADADGDALAVRTLSYRIDGGSSVYYDPEGWTLWRVRQDAGGQALLSEGFEISFGSAPATPPAQPPQPVPEGGCGCRAGRYDDVALLLLAAWLRHLVRTRRSKDGA